MPLEATADRAYTAVSFCSGIGGLDLAFDRAGFEIIGQVEIDEFCCKVLEREWPGVLRLRDMHDCGAHNLPYADVFFGGIPCQPHSTAGNRRGDEDDRNLWPDFRRIIGELRPRIVLLENVPGITASFRGSDGKRKPAYALTIVGDLTALGYDCEWATLFASDAGAPHPRERWILVAYATRQRAPTAQQQRQWRSTEQSGQELGNASGAGLSSWIETEQSTHGAQSRTGLESKLERSSEAVGHAHGKGPEGWPCIRENITPEQPSAKRTSNGDTSRTDESVLGRVLDGFPARLDRSRWPAPQGPFQYSWEPPRVTADKLKYRKDRIKAIGNAVVPQVVYPLACAIRDRLQAQDALSRAGMVEERTR